MIISFKPAQSTAFQKIIHCFIAITFISTMAVPPSALSAQTAATPTVELPTPGVMVPLSPAYRPALAMGLEVHPDNPLRFDFIIHRGESKLKGAALKNESSKLIKYFLAALTVPDEDMWVNLSPYEKDQIIPEKFGVTEMGRDLLAQDYLLKQLTASLVYPEDQLGQAFWKRVRQRAYEEYGEVELPVNTFNKVWVIPDRAEVFEQNNIAYIADSHLKVLLEEDYLALENNSNSARFRTDNIQDENVKKMSAMTAPIVREIIIPEIEKEINSGKNFAQLRQVYHSMILASWYKQRLKESLLGKVYMNKNKVAGIDLAGKDAKLKIYDRYMEAFRKGVYNYIRKDYDGSAQKPVPRKYFSGGVSGFTPVNTPFGGAEKVKTVHTKEQLSEKGKAGIKTIGEDSAMLARATVDLVEANEQVKKAAEQVVTAFSDSLAGDVAPADRASLTPQNYTPSQLWEEHTRVFYVFWQAVHEGSLAAPFSVDGIMAKDNPIKKYYWERNIVSPSSEFSELSPDAYTTEKSTRLSLRLALQIFSRKGLLRPLEKEKQLEDGSYRYGATFDFTQKARDEVYKLQQLHFDRIFGGIEFDRKNNRYIAQVKKDGRFGPFQEFVDMFILDGDRLATMNPSYEGRYFPERGTTVYLPVNETTQRLAKNLGTVDLNPKELFAITPHAAYFLRSLAKLGRPARAEETEIPHVTDMRKRMVARELIRKEMIEETEPGSELYVLNETGIAKIQEMEETGLDSAMLSARAEDLLRWMTGEEQGLFTMRTLFGSPVTQALLDEGAVQKNSGIKGVLMDALVELRSIGFVSVVEGKSPAEYYVTPQGAAHVLSLLVDPVQREAGRYEPPWKRELSNSPRLADIINLLKDAPQGMTLRELQQALEFKLVLDDETMRRLLVILKERGRVVEKDQRFFLNVQVQNAQATLSDSAMLTDKDFEMLRFFSALGSDVQAVLKSGYRSILKGRGVSSAMAQTSFVEARLEEMVLAGLIRPVADTKPRQYVTTKQGSELLVKKLIAEGGGAWILTDAITVGDIQNRVPNASEVIKRLIEDGWVGEPIHPGIQQYPILHNFGLLRLLLGDRIEAPFTIENILRSPYAERLKYLGLAPEDQKDFVRAELEKLIEKGLVVENNYPWKPKESAEFNLTMTGRRLFDQSEKKPGGIDFNSAHLNLQIKRDGNGVPLPVSQQPLEDMQIDGFLPVIIHIAPVMDLPVLLGIAKQQEKDKQAKKDLDPAKEPDWNTTALEADELSLFRT